ncbi:MAG TPA: biopolymer transporter ExbD [Bacteroidia bacterium]|nr:biopolymer transporter ExbD [Bacteroidia bacterium]
MQLRKKSKFSAHVETSSLNDIMFFLLLFFLIVSTLVNPSVVKLTLPNSKHSIKMSKEQITIDVTKDLQYYVNNKPVPFTDISTVLASKIAGLSEPTVVLRFDNSLSVQNLVDVLQIGNNLKVKMILATKSSEK